jgi:hypothetical protein
MSFIPTKAGLVVTGVRSFWIGGHGALTLKLALWDQTGGSLIDSGTVAVNAAGVYTVTFGSPHTLTSFNQYAVSFYENSGARQQYITTAQISTITGGTLVIGDLNGKMQWPGFFFYQGCFHSGDTRPSSNDNTDIYPVEPIFQ